MQTLTVRAHLLNDSFAHFYDKFHNNTHYNNTHNTPDVFYTNLQKKYTAHKEKTQQEFAPPYNSDGFFFKPYGGKPITCELNGVPCIANDLFNHDVMMCVVVCCYDFVNKENKRIVGVNIKVKSIRNILKGKSL